jgi:type IV conjugative transfer system protein TraL
MESLNNHIILGHIDKPIRILFWPANQFFACTVPLAVGMTTDHLIIGSIFAILVITFFKIFNKRFGKGRFRSIMYWHFPTPSRIIKMNIPPSYIRYWVK